MHTNQNQQCSTTPIPYLAFVGKEKAQTKQKPKPKPFLHDILE